MTLPPDRSYTSDHEWLQIDGDTATVGVTAYAADALGDVVYLELPGVGSTVKSGEVCGEIESTKSVSDLYAPADGEVVAINDSVTANPGVVNLDPYGEGWLLRIRLTDSPNLLDVDAYEALSEDNS